MKDAIYFPGTVREGGMYNKHFESSQKLLKKSKYN